MTPRFLLLALACALLALLACSQVSAQTEAAQYSDCNSCVENGWGWSWSKEECGAYLNTNCDADSADAIDEDEDDEEEVSQQGDAERAEAAAPTPSEPFRIPDPAPIPSDPLPWANTEATTQLWQLVNAGDLQTLTNVVYRNPELVHLRAEDGRTGLHWAYEYGKDEIVSFLLERGADANAEDRNGQKPVDMKDGAQENRDDL